MWDKAYIYTSQEFGNDYSVPDGLVLLCWTILVLNERLISEESWAETWGTFYLQKFYRTALYIIQVISYTYKTFTECHAVVHTLTYIYSATHVLLNLHGFMLLAPLPKGEGISSVPDTTYLGFCLASHPSCIFGGMSFLSAVPCAYLVALQLFLPWMCPCATTQVFAPVVVTPLTFVCKILTHCVWLHHHSVTKYSILVDLYLGPKKLILITSW